MLEPQPPRFSDGTGCLGDPMVNQTSSPKLLLDTKTRPVLFLSSSHKGYGFDRSNHCPPKSSNLFLIIVGGSLPMPPVSEWICLGAEWWLGAQSASGSHSESSSFTWGHWWPLLTLRFSSASTLKFLFTALLLVTKGFPSGSSLSSFLWLWSLCPLPYDFSYLLLRSKR